MKLKSLLICVLAIFLATPGTPAARSTIRNTEKRLKQYHSDMSERTLAGLFAIADQRMPDLIALLSSNDEGVRIEAQRIIRYSASPDGVAALAKSGTTAFTGPVPVPITEADLKLFDSGVFQQDPCHIGCTFVYALVLDPSDETQARYQTALKRVRPGVIRVEFRERGVHARFATAARTWAPRWLLKPSSSPKRICRRPLRQFSHTAETVRRL